MIGQVRIVFFEIMNLPTNFAYNEYINHALDGCTLKIAKNTLSTWISLLVVGASVELSGSSDIFLGVSASSFYSFVFSGVLLLGLDLGILVSVVWARESILAKLGATLDSYRQLDLVRGKWPAAESYSDVRVMLKAIEQQVPAQLNHHPHSQPAHLRPTHSP